MTYHGLPSDSPVVPEALLDCALIFDSLQHWQDLSVREAEDAWLPSLYNLR